MATAKFKISELTDNITSTNLSDNPGNYDLIINDLSGGSAETKRVGVDTLMQSIMGDITNPGDILFNGRVGINLEAGETADTNLEVRGNIYVRKNNDANRSDRTGAINASEVFVDISEYTEPPRPGQSVETGGQGYIAGFSFAGSPDDNGEFPPGGPVSQGEGGNDSGMFWDGDDRVFFNAMNNPGMVVAGRARAIGGPTAVGGQGTRGTRLMPKPGPDDNPEAFVGMGVVNPREKVHIAHGNLRIDRDELAGGTRANGKIIMQSPNGTHWEIIVNNSGTLEVTQVADGETIPGEEISKIGEGSPTQTGAVCDVPRSLYYDNKNDQYYKCKGDGTWELVANGNRG